MKKEIEIIDTMGRIIYPSISLPFLTDGNGQKTLQREQVSVYIQDQDGKESFICLDIDTAILLTDSILQLVGKILVDEARIQVEY